MDIMKLIMLFILFTGLRVLIAASSRDAAPWLVISYIIEIFITIMLLFGVTPTGV